MVQGRRLKLEVWLRKEAKARSVGQGRRLKLEGWVRGGGIEGEFIKITNAVGDGDVQVCEPRGTLF